MDVWEIKDWPLSSSLVDFLICDYCHFVDRDPNRSKTGYPCPVCKQPSKAGHIYFHFSVYILIDLMQESFHSKPWKKSGNNEMRENGERAHWVSVVLFFCTLKEVLLYRLIHFLLLAQKVPKGVYNRLLEDNKFHSDRINKLFPSLTGKKWKKAIKELDIDGRISYDDLNILLEKTTKSRNLFLHEGNELVIDKAMAENCMRNISALLNLFVELHNRYVYPLWR